MAAKKISVLGGGMSAMSAVYELLRADNYQGNYDITVYQMGWRIGGKGASGRERYADPALPAENNQRIQEHGLHAWFGWYSNAFNQFKDCYRHLGWGEEHRFNTWDKAFTPEDQVVVMQSIRDQWRGWELTVPSIPGEPGGTEELLSLYEYMKLLIHRLESFFLSHPLGIRHGSVPLHSGFFRREMNWIKDFTDKIEGIAVADMVRLMTRLIEEHEEKISQPSHPVRMQLLDVIHNLMHWLYTEFGELLSQDWETKKFFTLFDLGLAVVKGLVTDNVLQLGLNAINNRDFTEWIRLHGASEVTVTSALVRTVYDSCFAYRKGLKAYPDLEAGVALRIGFGIALGSKGHWIWKMNAGMGDTIFSPYYQALKKLGVKFRFFHKVKALLRSTDNSRVETVVMERQATCKPAYPEYQPTFPLGGVDCWPAEPFYDQLNEGEEMLRLKAEGRNVSLESFWSEWKGEEFSLKAGEDFDDIILNIPIAAHSHTCADLVQYNQRWMASILNVYTNQTFSTQLWITKTAEQLGWNFKAGCMTAFWEPADTFSDMTHLLRAENWNAETGPKQLTYLVGPFPEQPVVPPPEQTTFPAYMTNKCRSMSEDYLLNYINFIFPGSVENGTFDWNDLLDFDNRQGPERLKAQFFRVNTDPTERYTLSVKGSSAYRLKADESGFSNLYLSGDWTDNGVNAGCIEACVIAGMRCASALSGKDIPVVGDGSLYTMS